MLVIEDDRAIRLLYRVNLALEGFDVVEADTGSDGYRLALEAPDAIILDLRLPDCHGSEVLARLRGDPRTAGIPVLVISATADAETREDALASGAAGYVTKPFNPAQLGAIVGELLEEQETELAERARDRLLRRGEPAPGFTRTPKG